MKSVAWLIPVAILVAGLGCQTQPRPEAGARAHFTHGPMLGRVEAHQMGVWARTARSGKFAVRYGTGADRLDSLSPRRRHTSSGTTRVGFTSPTWDSGTRYHYRLVWLDGTEEIPGPGGTFQTLPSPHDVRHPQYNPEGRFNFRFEFACRQQPEYRQSGRLRMEPGRLRHHAQRTSGQRRPVADRFRHSQRGLAV